MVFELDIEGLNRSLPRKKGWERDPSNQMEQISIVFIPRITELEDSPSFICFINPSLIHFFKILQQYHGAIIYACYH